MENNLTLLLRQYEQKRLSAINDTNIRKLNLYNKYPELEKYDNDISSFSIKKIQLILTSNKNEIEKVEKRLSELIKEKDSFLKKYKISKNEFLPHYECDKCNDTGFISINNENTLCSCIKQKLYNIAYNNSNIYDLENQNFNNFNINLYSSEANKEKYKCLYLLKIHEKD